MIGRTNFLVLDNRNIVPVDWPIPAEHQLALSHLRDDVKMFAPIVCPNTRRHRCHGDEQTQGRVPMMAQENEKESKYKKDHAETDRQPRVDRCEMDFDIGQKRIRGNRRKLRDCQVVLDDNAHIEIL